MGWMRGVYITGNIVCEIPNVVKVKLFYNLISEELLTKNYNQFRKIFADASKNHALGVAFLDSDRNVIVQVVSACNIG